LAPAQFAGFLLTFKELRIPAWAITITWYLTNTIYLFYIYLNYPFYPAITEFQKKFFNFQEGKLGR
jgi:hypothetical protein